MSKRKKFNIVLAAANAVLLAAAAVLLLRISYLSGKYSTDSAKRSWDCEKYNYSQISMFFAPLSGVDESGIYSLRTELLGKLKESSILDDKENPAGRLWIDCAECRSVITVSGSAGSSEVIASGTMGDYFLFHPEPLMSGSYYSSDDINFDRIILDREASWRLFGSMDTAGMTVTAGEKTFYVAGVVKTPDSKRDKTAYGETPRVYMPFEALREIQTVSSFDTYEVCMPNIVKDYAYNTMKEIDPTKGGCIIVDQSGRFGVIKLVKESKDIYKSVMMDKYLAYPWYENRTRSAELLARMAAIPLPYLLIIPAFSLVYLIFASVKLLGRGARAIFNAYEKRYQAKITEEYRKKQQTS